MSLASNLRWISRTRSFFVRCFRTDVGAAKAADIQRRILQGFLQTAADFVGAGNSEELHQLLGVIRYGGENAFLFGSQRRYVIVKTFDNSAAIVVLHRRDELN